MPSASNLTQVGRETISFHHLARTVSLIHDAPNKAVAHLVTFGPLFAMRSTPTPANGGTNQRWNRSASVNSYVGCVRPRCARSLVYAHIPAQEPLGPKDDLINVEFGEDAGYGFCERNFVDGEVLTPGAPMG